MQRLVFADDSSVVIGIAVPAEMGASVIGPNVAAQETGAFLACGLVRWHFEAAMDGALIHCNGHTTTAIRSKLCKI